MDQSAQELQQYIDNLIPVVKTAVLSPEWRKRVGEIGQKFSLHLDQISSLEYEVFFVLIGMEPEEDLVGNIQRELNISNILATQVAEEVNTRVFQYILKLMQAQIPVESKEGIRNTPSSRAELATGQVKNDTENVIKPTPLLSEIETMAGEPNNGTLNTKYDGGLETAHHSKEVEPPVNLPGVMEEDRSKRYDVRDTSNTNTSTIQNITATESTIKHSPSFIDTKLNSIVSSKQESVVQEESPIAKGYVSDPYREPIE